MLFKYISPCSKIHICAWWYVTLSQGLQHVGIGNNILTAHRAHTHTQTHIWLWLRAYSTRESESYHHRAPFATLLADRRLWFQLGFDRAIVHTLLKVLAPGIFCGVVIICVGVPESLSWVTCVRCVVNIVQTISITAFNTKRRFVAATES